MNPSAALFYLLTYAAFFFSFFFSEFPPLYKINPNLFPRKKIILDNLDAPEKIIFRGG